eukprot:GHUV01020726.1.p2 GENE.GHUV01020726.1~~GHUV01020726.1.p2  ORF type:complete len:126 (+),score=28.72 GHUV01020726.1:339-716(+)
MIPCNQSCSSRCTLRPHQYPVLSAKHVATKYFHTLLQVPVRIPPGMPAEQAAGIIEYLKANPEAAKAAWSHAQAIMQNPGLANAFINMQVPRPALLQALVLATAACGEGGVMAASDSPAICSSPT